MAKHYFHVADFVVFGATIVISVAIGAYYALSGGRQRTTSEYLVGGRSMSFIPVAISLWVSFESSIMMLGLPAEAYVYGIQFIISAFGYMVSQFLSIHIVAPLLHPLKITSAYEYLELRFRSRGVRLVGTLMGMLTYIWYMGIVLFGPAVALAAVTDFPFWGSIFVIELVAVIYTAFGGLKAVIWTDVFQAFVMYAGIFSILIKGTIDTGGPKAVWDTAANGGRMNFFNFDVDPRVRHTFWTLFVGTVIRGFGLGFNQSTVQRISSTKSEREAKKMFYSVVPCFFASFVLAIYEGIVAFSYYQTKQCDPFASKQLKDPNQIIPYMVMDIFESLPGMPGLFLASLFSASLSRCCGGVEAQHRIVGGYRSYFLNPKVQLKSRGVCNTSLADSTTMETTVIPVLLAKIWLLLGVPTERWDRVLVSYGSLIAYSDIVFIPVCTLSSGLSSLSALLWADIVHPIVGPGISEWKATLIAKVAVLFFGILACGVAILVSLVGGTLTQISASLISAFSGPLTGIFFLGCFFPRANAKGAIAGGIAGMAYASWLSIGMSFSPAIKKTPWLPAASVANCPVDDVNGTDTWLLSNFTGIYNNYTTSTSILATVVNSTLKPNREPEGVEKMYTISYLYVSTLGTFATIFVGLIISLITGMNKPGDVDPRYLLSVSESLLIFLPRPIKKFLSSIGPQYMKPEYKNNFLDPAKRLDVPETELEIKSLNNDNSPDVDDVDEEKDLLKIINGDQRLIVDTNNK